MARHSSPPNHISHTHFLLRVCHQLPPQPQETVAKATCEVEICHSKPSCSLNLGQVFKCGA